MNSKYIKSSVFSLFIERIFPKSPNFFELLHQQSVQVCVTMDSLNEFLHSNNAEAAKLLKQDEHLADKLRINNLQQLNQAFATVIDREDIYRAINAMDGIVTHCKNSFNEMDALDLIIDDTCLAMVERLRFGVKSLEHGFCLLADAPLNAQEFAMTARDNERKVERLYYEGLGELFKTDDYIYIFKMKEFYQHLKHIGNRMKLCADVLEDIIVKIS